MIRLNFFVFPVLTCLFLLGPARSIDANGSLFRNYAVSGESGKDSLLDRQILYNGRIWRNLYLKVRGNQFLFSDEFLPGSVTIGKRTFDDVVIRYDIYNDEILIPTNRKIVLRLNSEMVDTFSVIYEGRKYRFARFDPADSSFIKGYVNILYDGDKTALYVKYKKEIDRLAIEDKYDVFYQISNIYLEKGNLVYHISGKRNFIRLFRDYKLLIRDFIKKNKIKISKKYPDSFIPVLEFYDNHIQ